MIYRLYTFLILFYISISTLFGQSYNVKRIAGLEGLSQNTIRSICVDHVGYIWLGTEFGLNRYDGRTIKKYHWDSEDPNTLGDDNINVVYEDENKDIWVCTTNGVCRYNRQQDIFSQNPLKIQNYLTAFCIYEDSTDIWFPSQDFSIYIYNKSSQETRNLKISSQFEWGGNWCKILDLIDYDENSLLVLDEWQGLFLLNKKTGELTEFFHVKTNRYTDVERIGKYFYLSSLNDIYKISGNGEVLNSFLGVNPSLVEPLPFKIKENPYDGNIWIVTDYSGVFIVDKNFKIIEKLESGSEAYQILPENSIKDVWFLNENTIVLGSVRCGGLILFKSEIEQYLYNKRLSTGPSDVSILCIEEDRDGQIWIGTDGGGINLFNEETNSFECFESQEVQIVTSILDFSETSLLLASYQKGLFFFDKQTKQFSDAHNYTLFKQVVRDVRHKLFRDSKDNIWISDGGIVKINQTNNSLERFTWESDPEIFGGILPIYFTVYESSSGKLWFGTIGGIYSYSLITNRLVDRVVLQELNNSAGSSVYTIIEDKNGDLILATSKGLQHYSIKTGTLKAYLEDPNFNNKRFSSLYFDKKGQLWAGTNDALLRIVENDGKKEVLAFNNLGFGGGKEYRHDAVLRASDNRLYMGSNNGIVSFVPEKVGNNEVTSKVVITSFKKKGNKKGELTDSTIVVDCMENHQATFRYSPSIFQFKFNAFNIPFEEFTEYEYTLENFEDIWHRGRGNVATYTNLSAGEYVFKVRATNQTGQWGAKITSIGIKILPPWYETTWFWSIVILVLTVIIFLVWRESLVRLKLKHQLQLKEAEQQQIEERNRYKLQFFTNISHELKTPLTLIYSPLKQLITRNISETEIKLALPPLFRNVQRMMLIIDQLLEFRKAEMSQLKINVSKVNCVELCNEIIGFFEYYVKAENVRLELKAEEEQMEVELDRDKFVKILTNLISNALKHSTQLDYVFVFLSWKDGQILIQVKDNGQGIPQKEQERIFDRYYQVKEKLSGMGIGLALTKQLVEIHNGTISVESKEGEGTIFSVLLPKKQKGGTVLTDRENDSYFEKIDNMNYSLPQLELNVEKETNVLVVEDEMELRHFLKNELSEYYSVHTARNGKEGLEKALEIVPEIIISDVLMPVMDGYELCENIKNEIKVSHVPIILLTAKSQKEHHAMGLKAGADLYVPKPFDMELLLLQVKGLLKNRNLLKNRFSSDPKIKMDELVHSSVDKDFIDKAIKLVEENLDNQHFKVSDFVNGMGMSRSLVYNKINAIAGKPVNDFILHIKLQNAAKLLATKSKSISDVAYACGFSDPNYFSTVFKRYYSKSPMAYRKEI